MPHYCPVCLGEYKVQIVKCPKDATLLINKKPPAFDRLVDIYAASDEIESERIVLFLRDKGFVARESISGISQMPVVSDTRFIISVLKEDRKEARAVLEQARNDKVISRNGNFL